MENIKTIVIPCEGDIVKFAGHPADTGTVLAVTASDMVLVRWHNTEGDTAVPHDTLEFVAKLPRIPHCIRSKPQGEDEVVYEYRACFAVDDYTLARFACIDSSYGVNEYFYRAAWHGMGLSFTGTLAGGDSFGGCRAALVEIATVCGSSKPTLEQWRAACVKGAAIARQQSRNKWDEGEDL